MGSNVLSQIRVASWIRLASDMLETGTSDSGRCGAGRDWSLRISGWKFSQSVGYFQADIAFFPSSLADQTIIIV